MRALPDAVAAQRPRRAQPDEPIGPGARQQVAKHDQQHGDASHDQPVDCNRPTEREGEDAEVHHAQESDDDGDEQVVHALELRVVLAPRVDAVLYAEEHAPGGKPSRAAFDAVLAAVGVPASRAVFIGDDLVRDIQGARAAGMSTIRVTTGAGQGRTEGDADVIARLEEVPAAAGRLVQGSGVHAA